MDENNFGYRKEIGTIVLNEIKELNLSIESISKNTGLTKHIIYRIMKGNGYTIDSLIKVCNHLKLEIKVIKK